MMKIRLIALMSLAGVIALSGCTVGPDYKRPTLDVPLEYRQISKEVEDNAQWLTARWWTQYQDPAIDALVSSAIKNNRTLQQTMSNVEKAAAAVTVARADLFPQLNYQGDAMRQRQSINTAMGEALQGKPFSTKEVLASASWEIDLWGKIRRKTESATATLRSMEAAHKAALSSVITSVVTTYLSILTVDEQLEVAKETANSYYQTYSLFKVRATHGNVSDMEVAQAKSQWQSAKVEIPVLQQSRVELMNSLSILTGVDVGDMPKFKRLRALKVPAIGKGIPSKLLTERPDIVEAEENLKAANADIGAARAMYFPSISLSGGLGFSSEELHDLIKSPSRVWSVGGNITGPIFHWGAVEAGVKQAEAQQKGLVAAYRLAVSQAFADVDNALSKRQKALQELKDRTGLVASLKEYKRLATAQYQEDYTGYFTVLQAEQSLLPQQLQLAQVRANTLSSIASIYQSLGGGWIDLALQEERQAIADLEREEQLKKEIQEASPEEREENSMM